MKKVALALLSLALLAGCALPEGKGPRVCIPDSGFCWFEE